MSDNDILSEASVGRWVLHMPTGTVGQVKAVPPPVENDDKLPWHLRPAQIVELQQGHLFIAEPRNFALLEQAEVEVFGTFRARLGQAVTEAVVDLAQRVVDGQLVMPEMQPTGITAEGARKATGRAVRLVKAALQEQLRALEVGAASNTEQTTARLSDRSDSGKGEG